VAGSCYHGNESEFYP